VTDRARIAAVDELLDGALREKIFPAAAVEMGDSRAAIYQGAFGTLTFDPGAPATTDDTIFDLASLTKPVVTTTLAMEHERRRTLALGEPLSRAFAEWRGGGREVVTVRDVLEHASGLPARLANRPPDTRREFVHEICRTDLEYTPRQRSIYSDLGFILLGVLIEDRAGATLAAGFRDLWQGEPGDILDFDVPSDMRRRTAPTIPLSDDWRKGRTLVGEVHDSYAALLGGAAGHSGLFGTARALGRFARTMLRGARGDQSQTGPFAPAIVARMVSKSTVPGSSRALGWDTMLPTSSCGAFLSPAAFGHVGFTGTSLWIDPVLDRYFILLTNRVCGGGTLEQIRAVRRRFHDVLAAA